MSLNIRPNAPSGSDFDPSQIAGSDAASVVLDIRRKKVRIRKSKLKDVTRGLAEIAYSLGETNDIDAFEEEMTNTIFAAFKDIENEKSPRKG